MSTESDLTRETIEHLDFDPPCEYGLHKGPAAANLAVLFAPTPCGCSPTRVRMFCEPCWAFRGSTGFCSCLTCGGTHPAFGHVVRVERLK